MPRCPSCLRRVAAGSSCAPDTWAAPREEAAPAAGSAPRLAGFTIGRRIGWGGFAEVWEAARRPPEARPRAHDGPVESHAAPFSAIPTMALKVGRGDQALLVARFGREAEALIRVGPPHAPRLHAYGALADGRPYLLMDLVPGATFATWLERLDAPPETSRALAVAIAIARAVEGAHDRGVLHRDLKPENVFLDEAAGLAVLVDFGLARGPALAGAAAPITRPGTAAGTLEYVAPEQLRADPAQDARADVYSLGVMLYELLTLRPPFAGDAAEVEYGHIALRPRRPSELSPVPGALERLVLACLAKDPARRPPGAADVRRAIEGMRSPGAPSAEAGAPDADAAPRRDAPAARSSGATPQRTAASAGARGAMIADGRRPAVVVLVETAAPAPEVLRAVSARRGLLARQRGRRYVAVFSAADVDAPIEAAIDVANELCAAEGARAAVHLAPVTIRTRPDGAPAVHGAALDRPETWLPARWSKEPAGRPPAAAASPAAAAKEGSTPPGATSLAAEEGRTARSEPTAAGAPASPHDGLLAPSVVLTPEVERLRAAPAAPAQAAIVGRGEALATLDRSAAIALSGRPALATVIGDHGLGKSRLAAEAAARYGGLAGAGKLVSIRAAQPLAGEVERTSAELLAALCGGPPAAPAHRVDRARAVAAAIAAAVREGPLAIVLDDAHWADDATLDALELSTLQGPGALWVVVAAHPRFDDARRGWGGRAERHDRVLLGPLAEPDGKELAAALLAPAEYPPADALAQLCAWAGGNPACLAEIAGALKSAGLVRRRSGSGGHYLATSELRSLPASPAWQWLAARALDAMPVELAACARLCAVLGAAVSRDEIEAAQEALERADAPSTPIDAGVGLRALCERGVLVPAGSGRFSFRSAVLEGAVRAMVDGAHRERIHRAALDLWRGRAAAGAPGEPGRAAATLALERVARHAAAAGERAEAARALLSLGDLERAAHRYFTADTHYTAALEQLGDADPARRAAALAGRGKVRYRLHRTADSLADLEAARALAARIDDERLLAELLLEEATALDWVDDFDRSADRLEAARAPVARLADRRLALRLRVAEGRSAWRHGRVDEAIERLEPAAAEARVAQDYEALVVALLLLSCALVVAGRPDDAEARSDEVIALVSEARDGAHLSIAYLNRFFLWSVRKDLERAAADMRRALDLAREVGNPWPERGATTNLAELLFWCGHDDESLRLAARGRSLEERFSPRPVHESALVQARVHAARGDHAEATELAAWIDAHCPPGPSAPGARVQLGAVKLVVSGSGSEGAWDALLADGSALVPVERLELLHLRARAAKGAGRAAEVERARAEAAALFGESPDFARRFAAL